MQRILINHIFKILLHPPRYLKCCLTLANPPNVCLKMETCSALGVFFKKLNLLNLWVFTMESIVSNRICMPQHCRSRSGIWDSADDERAHQISYNMSWSFWISQKHFFETLRQLFDWIFLFVKTRKFYFSQHAVLSTMYSADLDKLEER